jgi:hypothetical protein
MYLNYLFNGAIKITLTTNLSIFRMTKMEMHPYAKGVSNLDYIGMDATGYLDVVGRQAAIRKHVTNPIARESSYILIGDIISSLIFSEHRNLRFTIKLQMPWSDPSRGLALSRERISGFLEGPG